MPGNLSGWSDIFVRDRLTEKTEQISVASDGTQADSHSYRPSISAQGRYIAFASDATNLVSSDTNAKCDIFVHDCQTGITERISIASDGTEANDESYEPSISADGRFVAFDSYASKSRSR